MKCLKYSMPNKSEPDGYAISLKKAQELEKNIALINNPCRLFKYEKELSTILSSYKNMCVFFALQSKVRDVRGSNADSAVRLKHVTAAIDKCVHALEKQYVVVFDKLIGLAKAGKLEKLLLKSAKEYIRKSDEDEIYKLISTEEMEVESHELEWVWNRYSNILEGRGEPIDEDAFDLINKINLKVLYKIKEKVLGIAS